MIQTGITRGTIQVTFRVTCSGVAIYSGISQVAMRVEGIMRGELL